jgi:hypothetical protein
MHAPAHLVGLTHLALSHLIIERINAALSILLHIVVAAAILVEVHHDQAGSSLVECSFTNLSNSWSFASICLTMDDIYRQARTAGTSMYRSRNLMMGPQAAMTRHECHIDTGVTLIDHPKVKDGLVTKTP